MNNTTSENVEKVIEATNSVVHQTFNDINDIGDVVDKSNTTLESLHKEFKIFKKNYTYMQMTLEQTIASEVAKQLKPIQDQLDTIITQKPKAIYIVPKMPNFFKWLFRFSFRRKDKEAV